MPFDTCAPASMLSTYKRLDRPESGKERRALLIKLLRQEELRPQNFLWSFHTVGFVSNLEDLDCGTVGCAMGLWYFSIKETMIGVLDRPTHQIDVNIVSLGEEFDLSQKDVYDIFYDMSNSFYRKRRSIHAFSFPLVPYAQLTPPVSPMEVAEALEDAPYASLRKTRKKSKVE